MDEQPGLRVIVSWWLLLWTHAVLRSVQRGIWYLYRRFDGPIELVHRPIRILGARYMDALVNRKKIK